MRLRTFHWLALAGVSLLVAAACSAPAPAPPPAKTEPPFRTTATIKDIMDSMVDPSADYLWESVATIVTKAGHGGAPAADRRGLEESPARGHHDD